MRYITASLLLVASGVVAGGTARAQEAAQELPLHDVVLFSSGVGYFGRAGQINGASEVDLSFRADQINDILKSLVVFDAGNGVQPITYSTKDPLSRQLRATGVALNGTISLGTLLSQFQGARVRVEVPGEAIEGRIISVNTKTVPPNPYPVPLDAEQKGDARPIFPQPGATVEILNLNTDAGLQAVPLDRITRVKLLDARLNKELSDSLELMATGLNNDQRTVQLHFDGNGAREARVGYLSEMPVWKTTYRLVLNEKEKPYFQGWGIVENTTDEDWKGVRLSLVSGRPISFIQDLYQPLYVPRPVVAPQVIGSPLPQAYGEQVDAPPRVTITPSLAYRTGGASYVNGAPAPTNRATQAAGMLNNGNFAGGVSGGAGGFLGGSNFDRASNEPQNAAIAGGVAAQAQGAERGELFEYAIKKPVNLPKQQAAMVPILGQAIEGEKISIYDVNSSLDRALNGYDLKNNTGLHLSGGPITVFQDGIYAGDGQINDVQPGEERLISYAVDLDLVVSHEAPNYHQETLTISAKSGVLTITRKQRLEQTYSFRNKGDAAKAIIVQQNIEPNFTLIEPAKPAAKTATQYRFRVDVPGKKTTDLKVVTEQPLSETVALIDADINTLIAYAKETHVSPQLRAALQDLVTRRRAISDIQAQIARIDDQVKEINDAQSRIRQNMDRLDHNSDLYKSYVQKLTAQETQIQTLSEQRAKLQDAQAEAEKQLRAYVDGLTVA